MLLPHKISFWRVGFAGRAIRAPRPERGRDGQDGAPRLPMVQVRACSLAEQLASRDPDRQSDWEAIAQPQVSAQVAQGSKSPTLCLGDHLAASFGRHAWR